VAEALGPGLAAEAAVQADGLRTQACKKRQLTVRLDNTSMLRLNSWMGRIYVSAQCGGRPVCDARYIGTWPCGGGSCTGCDTGPPYSGGGWCCCCWCCCCGGGNCCMAPPFCQPVARTASLRIVDVLTRRQPNGAGPVFAFRTQGARAWPASSPGAWVCGSGWATECMGGPGNGWCCGGGCQLFGSARAA